MYRNKITHKLKKNSNLFTNQIMFILLISCTIYFLIVIIYKIAQKIKKNKVKIN